MPAKLEAARAVRRAERLTAAEYNAPLTGKHLWRLIAEVAAAATRTSADRVMDRDDSADLFSRLGVHAAKYLVDNPGPYAADDVADLRSALTGAVAAERTAFRRERGDDLQDRAAGGLPPTDIADLIGIAETAATLTADRADKTGSAADCAPGTDPLPPELQSLRELTTKEIAAAAASALMPRTTAEEWADPGAENCAPGTWRKRASKGRKALEADPGRLANIAALVRSAYPAAEPPNDDWAGYRRALRALQTVAAQPADTRGRAPRLRAAVALVTAYAAGAARVRPTTARVRSNWPGADPDLMGAGAPKPAPLPDPWGRVRAPELAEVWRPVATLPEPYLPPAPAMPSGWLKVPRDRALEGPERPLRVPTQSLRTAPLPMGAAERKRLAEKEASAAYWAARRKRRLARAAEANANPTPSR